MKRPPLSTTSVDTNPPKTLQTCSRNSAARAPPFEDNVIAQMLQRNVLQSTAPFLQMLSCSHPQEK
ncbi:hypothetical protein DPMN_095280 [Dreissena polymorpha]|uniref:Uncharacterized protein n=1 Tax=Dreissena polymorpha TaxID=45954 RepID=A0A9D4L914_DREPO|nr:hypothetical protein DPMN_095280 [Dreissena polymorpha]